MIAPKNLIAIAVALLFNYPAHVWAGCNAPNNQGQYTIAITGGKNSVQDGESSTYTCTMTPSVSGVTPTWSLTPTGGGTGGLVTPVITPTTDGKSATVKFYWHALNPTSYSCTYKLECKTDQTCITTKTITVSLPSPPNPWGSVYCQVVVNVSTVLGQTPNTWRITGALVDIPRFDPPNYNLHADSQFKPKTVKHEAKHTTDYTGRTASPAAQQGVIAGNAFFANNNYLNRDLTQAQGNTAVAQMNQYITLQSVWGPPGNTTSWTEIRAYTVSNAETPDYHEPTLTSSNP